MTHTLPRRGAVVVFLAFALAYFLSALVRAVTATLAPSLAQEFALQARDLGLLAGGYFLGFAAMQLPLGSWLDRHGPKKVSLGLLGVAVAGSLWFSVATGFSGLFAGRVLCGVGVSACLMAPLTGYRRWFQASAQMRANAWMLMTGSLGMVASTLPVQWVLPLAGWRPLFWGLALLIALSMAVIALWVPGWWAGASPRADGAVPEGYAMVWRHPYFRRLAPLGFFFYGGMLAMQTLWAGPWMQRVAGYTPLESAAGLFWINVSMLGVFWAWGMLSPWLLRKVGVDQLMAAGLPLCLLVLLGIIGAGPQAGSGAWALFCISCTCVSLSQPAVAMAFPPALAGRALSAYNLVIFAGVFVVQWGIGLAVDAFAALGLSTVSSFQAAMALYLSCSAMAYAWFLLRGRRDNALPSPAP
ncbi:MFS transporter [Verminephrobacter aporrectodeae]|uniref:MFS transporter n=1 Tax=Verminephrobacter aporrectodeae TaxID=1110389 RepID=UPI0022371D0F|nr:MFS transporter [Verminephrobacter aporrectodeae]MCW5256759.1 MFS transporter [Verminephrobacter aporrectodeae subsp. tuberculatae]MCW8174184.1 MFS transporter [Verminephrobacter aporrectodeae subsp. tuberculatae]MCW8201847.1 MFS transporter [Verminephrobacter aporrectodeae subsp. tuberculatae]